MEFTPIESAILEWCASSASCEEAATQFRSARPIARHFTGVGSYTDLAIPEAVARIPNSSIPHGPRGPFNGPDVFAKELELGACALIFCADGRLAFLEIAAYGNSFPEQLTDITLRAN
jgi:hypothetical protein